MEADEVATATLPPDAGPADQPGRFLLVLFALILLAFVLIAAVGAPFGAGCGGG